MGTHTVHVPMIDQYPIQYRVTVDYEQSLTCAGMNVTTKQMNAMFTGPSIEAATPL